MESIRELTGKAHEFFIALEKAGFKPDDIQLIINSKKNKLAVDLYKAFKQITNKSQCSDLFGQPLLEKQVTIRKNFSLDKNIGPKEEFAYGFVSSYARDKYFAAPTLSGQANLMITPTTRDSTNKEIATAANQQDAVAIISALHDVLIENPNSLDQFKDSVIIIPVLSVAPDGDGDLFCLYLDWNGSEWDLYNDWIDRRWSAGVHVASLAQ